MLYRMRRATTMLGQLSTAGTMNCQMEPKILRCARRVASAAPHPDPSG
jgi:hypothetical protein